MSEHRLRFRNGTWVERPENDTAPARVRLQLPASPGEMPFSRSDDRLIS